MKRTIIFTLALFTSLFGLISCGSVPQQTEKPVEKTETKIEKQHTDEEYKRSIGEIAEVSKEEFIQDKTEIFIPSRKQSKVDEIRYINKSEVKAVQVLPNNSTVVYYNFIREDGKWKVNIPTL